MSIVHMKGDRSSGKLFFAQSWLLKTLLVAILLGFIVGLSVADGAAAAGPETGPNLYKKMADSETGATRDGARTSAAESDPLLPDLTVLPPHDLKVEKVAWLDGGPHLRFGNTIINIGTGPLELRAINKPEKEVSVVYQRVCYTQWEAKTEHEVGRFIYHAPHYHWHLDDFVRYEIWSTSPQGMLGQKLQSSGKISYCMSDVDPAPDIPLAGTPAPSPIYLICENQRQGLLVGWTDVYHYWYEGQSLNVGDLAPGIYALRNIVDPDNIVRERDESNNASLVYFKINDKKITVYGSRADLPKEKPQMKSPQRPHIFPQ
ncbi:MAG: lysyl oxidase family protein [Anaerolineales bacterium]